MNVKLLKKVKAKILSEPKQFQMSKLFSVELDNGQLCNVNCGTAACIAGWALCITQRRKPKAIAKDYYAHQLYYYAHRLLNEMFGLPLSEEGDQLINTLVYDDYWPQPFRGDYKKAVSSNRLVAAAKVAAARIDHFIKYQK